MGSAGSGANAVFTGRSSNYWQWMVTFFTGELQALTQNKTAKTCLWNQQEQAVRAKYKPYLQNTGGAFSQAGYLQGSSNYQERYVILQEQESELAQIRSMKEDDLAQVAEQENNLQTQKTLAETNAKMFEQMHEGLVKLNEKNIQNEYKFRLGGMA